MRVRLSRPFDLAEKASRGPGGGSNAESEVLRATDAVIKVVTRLPGPDLVQTVRGENLSSPRGRVDVWDWDLGRRDLADFRDMGLRASDFVEALQVSRGGFIFEKVLDGSDTLVGSSGDDTLAGFGGGDRIRGGDGDDVLFGGDDRDQLKGGDGDDRIEGGRQRDSLKGGAGDDVLDGGGHMDVLKGEAGDDLLRGGSGSDRLDGGPGRDRLIGGADRDAFLLRRGGGKDVVVDFELDRDRIDTLGGRGLDDLRVEARDGGVLLSLDGPDRLLLRGLTLDDVADIEFI